MRTLSSQKSLMKRLLSYLIPAAIGLIAFAWVAVPIAMAVLWSLVDPNHPWTYPDVFPSVLSLAQWERIFEYTNILSAIKNSVFIAVSATLLSILISLPTAYATQGFRGVCRRDRKLRIQELKPWGLVPFRTQS